MNFLERKRVKATLEKARASIDDASTFLADAKDYMLEHASEDLELAIAVASTLLYHLKMVTNDLQRVLDKEIKHVSG